MSKPTWSFRMLPRKNDRDGNPMDHSIRSKGLAHTCYDNRNIGANIASGSFLNEGMVVIPCAMKTLSPESPIPITIICWSGAADVTLKEKRKLFIVARETAVAQGTFAADDGGRRSRRDNFTAGNGLLLPAPDHRRHYQPPGGQGAGFVSHRGITCFTAGEAGETEGGHGR